MHHSVDCPCCAKSFPSSSWLARQRAALLIALVAIAAPLAGCQIAMSTIRAKAGLAPGEPTEPTNPIEAAPAPQQTAAADQSSADDPTDGSAPAEDSGDQGGDQGYAEPVAALPPPPRCTAPGRPGMCDGQCVDLQVNANYCGACFNHCHSGDHCDYGQCRDADGKPD